MPLMANRQEEQGHPPL